jgi:hypothetical protein
MSCVARTLHGFIDALRVAPAGWRDARHSLLVVGALLGAACGGKADDGSESCTGADCAGQGRTGGSGNSGSSNESVSGGGLGSSVSGSAAGQDNTAGSDDTGSPGGGLGGSCTTCTGGSGGGLGGSCTTCTGGSGWETNCFNGVTDDMDDLVDCDDPDCADPCLPPEWDGCTADGLHACQELVGSNYFETRPDCAAAECGDGPYLPCAPVCAAPRSYEYPPGTVGNWSGCRGDGISVCIELVTEIYFERHPACKPNDACAGQYYICNEVCPSPVDDEVGAASPR